MLFNEAGFNNFLKSSIVSPFNKPLGSSLQDFLHLPPMIPMRNDIFADFQVLFEGKVFLIDVRP